MITFLYFLGIAFNNFCSNNFQVSNEFRVSIEENFKRMSYLILLYDHLMIVAYEWYVFNYLKNFIQLKLENGIRFET